MSYRGRSVYILVFLALAIVLTCIVGVYRGRNQTDLILLAVPKGAKRELRVDVLLNGKLALREVPGGRAREIFLRPGHYHITVTARGYGPYSTNITASPNGGEAYVYAELIPISKHDKTSKPQR